MTRPHAQIRLATQLLRARRPAKTNVELAEILGITPKTSHAALQALRAKGFAHDSDVWRLTVDDDDTPPDMCSLALRVYGWLRDRKDGTITESRAASLFGGREGAAPLARHALSELEELGYASNAPALTDAGVLWIRGLLAGEKP